MKPQDKKLLHSKTLPELQEELNKAIKELSLQKLDLKTNQLKDTSQIKKMRNKIAVLKTIIHSRPKTDSDKVLEKNKKQKNKEDSK